MILNKHKDRDFLIKKNLFYKNYNYVKKINLDLLKNILYKEKNCDIQYF